MDCKRVCLLIMESIINSSNFIISNLDTEDITYILPDYDEIIKQEKEFTIDFELENLFDDKHIIENTDYNELYRKITNNDLIVIHKMFHKYIANHILKLNIEENIVFRVRTNNSKILYNELIDMGIDIDLFEYLVYS